MKISLFPVGTRVRTRRGSLPMDAKLLDRTGLVLHHDRSTPDKVGVQLDGEEEIRTFTDEELEGI